MPAQVSAIATIARRRLLTDSDQLSADILAQIIGGCDRSTQVVCLHVSLTFLELAGNHIYRQVVIDDQTAFDQVFKGWDARESKGDSADAATQAVGSQPQIGSKRKLPMIEVNDETEKASQDAHNAGKNYKQQLLERIKCLVVGDHVCWQSDDPARVIAAVKLAINVERVIISPALSHCHTTGPLCEYDDCDEVFPILKGLEGCKKATFHNIGRHGLVHAIGPLFSGLETLTLVIPPAGCIFEPHEHGCTPSLWDQAHELRHRTLHIKTVRIVIATLSPTSMTDESMYTLRSLEYMACFLANHLATLEIFVFGYMELDPFNSQQYRRNLLFAARPEAAKPVDDAAEKCDSASDIEKRLSLVGGLREYYSAHRPNVPEFEPKFADHMEMMHQRCLDRDIRDREVSLPEYPQGCGTVILTIFNRKLLSGGRADQHMDYTL